MHMTKEFRLIMFGVWMGMALALSVFVIILVAAPAKTPPSTIGGTQVPRGLTCEEDEAIAFHGQPDDLTCIHVDAL